jgi:hypothetical protein
MQQFTAFRMGNVVDPVGTKLGGEIDGQDCHGNPV